MPTFPGRCLQCRQNCKNLPGMIVCWTTTSGGTGGIISDTFQTEEGKKNAGAALLCPSPAETRWTRQRQRRKQRRARRHGSPAAGRSLSDWSNWSLDSKAGFRLRFLQIGGVMYFSKAKSEEVQWGCLKSLTGCKWPLGPSLHMPPPCSHAKDVHRAHVPARPLSPHMSLSLFGDSLQLSSWQNLQQRCVYFTQRTFRRNPAIDFPLTPSAPCVWLSQFYRLWH